MILNIGLFIPGLIGMVIVFAATKAAMMSSEYTIVRQITINAPAEKIFPYLNSTQLADNWAPWSQIDPQAKMNHSGPSEGIGSRASWASKGQLGTGSATIVGSVPNQSVQVLLEYLKPMKMTQNAEYAIASSGNQSTVSWSVRGTNTFPCRVACVFMNMDKVVGGMFELGLSNLKNLMEKAK